MKEDKILEEFNFYKNEKVAWTTSFIDGNCDEDYAHKLIRNGVYYMRKKPSLFNDCLYKYIVLENVRLSNHIDMIVTFYKVIHESDYSTRGLGGYGWKKVKPKDLFNSFRRRRDSDNLKCFKKIRSINSFYSYDDGYGPHKLFFRKISENSYLKIADNLKNITSY